MAISETIYDLNRDTWWKVRKGARYWEWHRKKGQKLGETWWEYVLSPWPTCVSMDCFHRKTYFWEVQQFSMYVEFISFLPDFFNIKQVAILVISKQLACASYSATFSIHFFVLQQLLRSSTSRTGCSKSKMPYRLLRRWQLGISGG